MNDLQLFLIGLSLLICSPSDCQSLTENQEKYWDYRDRLTDEFMVVGIGQGKSLPAESVEPNGWRIRFADATVYLGWYIATLSTEHLLSTNGAFLRTEGRLGVSKDKTLKELYYALKTLERLDLNAEPFFDPKASKDLNGFFLRDDVPSEMKEEFNVKRLQSDYSANAEGAHNEVSQDQVYHLLMGLMCVKELIPSGTVVEGENIRALAVKEGERIIDWLKQHDWRVVNPILTKKNGKPDEVFVGHQAYIFSKGINRILYHLSDGEKGADKKNLSPIYSLYWGTTRMGINPTFASNDNRHMAITVAATGNGWKRNSFKKVVKRSDQDDWYAYPLLNLMLYPKNRYQEKSLREVMDRSLDLLNKAPAEGPVCTYPEVREDGWSANHMFLKDREYQKTCRKYHATKIWNGLDYMLFHNLYLIHKNKLVTSD